MRDTVVGIVLGASAAVVSRAGAQNAPTFARDVAGYFTCTIDSQAKSATAGEGRARP